MQKMYLVTIGNFYRDHPHSSFYDTSLTRIQEKLRLVGYRKKAIRGKERAFYEHPQKSQWAKVFDLPQLPMIRKECEYEHEPTLSTLESD